MVFSIRLTKKERELANSYSKLHSISLGEAFKKAFFEKVEDEFDIALAEEALEEYKKDDCKSRPINKLWEECNL